jgi:site-specific DNA-methyltransferase (adenine-specific)
MKKKFKLMLGDNIESLKKLPDNSIDSIVTDPPYALTSIRKRFGKEGSAPAQYGTDGAFQRASKGFMGKEWDAEVPTVEFWREVYRVLKPGGHVLSFGGTRTYHRMVVNIEDAGFEIRDQIMWLYGSGFPKSHNISKAIDKVEGNERKVIGKKIQRVDGTLRNQQPNGGFMKENVITKKSDGYIDVEEPGSDNSKKYNGWGTALKPANEPICVARKPLSEKSVAENVLKWGTGGINIDGCRVGYANEADEKSSIPGSLNSNQKNSSFGIGEGHQHNSEGRFPANIILECLCDEIIDGGFVKSGSSNRTDKGIVAGVNGFGRGTEVERTTKIDIHTNPMCPCLLLDEQSGVSESKKGKPRITKNFNQNAKIGGGECNVEYNDKGGASRFFYQAKVSKAERNMGLDEFEDKVIEGRDAGQDERAVAFKKRPTPTKNTHPTVKPVSLMAYLCRLVTPVNGIVLDPFMGSGSTGIAARLEGFRFCGMEMDKDYFKIAESRIESFEEYRKFLKK